MNKKYSISTGTNVLQSVNRNTFSQIGGATSSLSFIPRKSGYITPTNEYISLERRRTYQYYEKK